MLSQPQPATEITRLERLVGEVTGIRMLLSEILDGDQARRERVREGALKRLEQWKIGSDTPEGADRIRYYVQQMLTAFPEAVPPIGSSEQPTK